MRAARTSAGPLVVLALLGATAATAAGCDGCKGGPAPADAAGPTATGTTVAPYVNDAGEFVGDASTVLPITDGGGRASTLNATPIPTASVAAMVNPDHLPPYQGPTGSVEGTVTVTGEPARVVPGDYSTCPDAKLLWGKTFREGPVGPGGGRMLADSLVVVTGYKGFVIEEKRGEAVTVTIEGCGYKSRTRTMTFGQRLEVKNLSKDFWTPKLEPSPNLVIMMAVPHGDPVKIYPKTPGHFLLLDQDRRYAVVDVYAFLHPLHTATDPFGHYRIDGLPVGKLRVSTKHPNIDATDEKDIEVTAGGVVNVDLVLKNAPRDAGVKDAGADAPYVPVIH